MKSLPGKEEEWLRYYLEVNIARMRLIFEEERWIIGLFLYVVVADVFDSKLYNL